MPVTITHDDIAARIPHAGTMCLLDAVIDWGSEYIHCQASSHRDPANPLRSGGRLGVLCGIEYAAQAMALHGGLGACPPGESGQRPQAGFLASVRGVTAHVARLDDGASDLLIEARRVSGDDGLVIYEFSVRDADRLLIEGRAAVVMDAGALLSSEPKP
ncbi:hotdog family protein [Aquabacterium sp.]|uniref:hotdog family protein n=1 Tax=Aquabacterium sp. TaxID=1872578 RepID=UPI0019A2EEB4|nr:hotdog family protein [Aquabacterium sp.]MBC7701071.1 hotdog family protein [Aquabacterium sp.]